MAEQRRGPEPVPSVSCNPMTPEDLRDDARTVERVAASTSDLQSRYHLFALSRKFLDMAAQVESAMKDSSQVLDTEASAPLPPMFGTTGYWRERATEARAMLDHLREPEAVKAMQLVVENYDRLARISARKETAAGQETPRRGIPEVSAHE